MTQTSFIASQTTSTTLSGTTETKLFFTPPWATKYVIHVYDPDGTAFQAVRCYIKNPVFTAAGHPDTKIAEVVSASSDIVATYSGAGMSELIVEVDANASTNHNQIIFLIHFSGEV